MDAIYRKYINEEMGAAAVIFVHTFFMPSLTNVTKIKLVNG